MATGPQHYTESERLLKIKGAWPETLAKAQAHATLAMAAAVALTASASQAPHTTEAARDWREVLKPAEQTADAL